MNSGFELPTYSFFQTWPILCGVMIVRYFGMAFLFSIICRGKNPIVVQRPSLRHVQRDIVWSILSSVIFALNGALLILLWKSGHAKIETDELRYFHIINFLLFFVLHDAYFYLIHRLLHRYNYLFKFHRIHHMSRIPTVWTSFSFHPVEAFAQAVILLILVTIFPIHWILFFLFLLVMSLTGFLNHLGYELYPEILEKKFGFINASHHQYHHKDMNSNFGLYFTWWDRWLKTEALDRHGK